MATTACLHAAIVLAVIGHHYALRTTDDSLLEEVAMPHDRDTCTAEHSLRLFIRGYTCPLRTGCLTERPWFHRIVGDDATHVREALVDEIICQGEQVPSDSRLDALVAELIASAHQASSWGGHLVDEIAHAGQVRLTDSRRFDGRTKLIPTRSTRDVQR